MKTEKKAVSFLLTMTLIFSCVFLPTAVYGEETMPVSAQAKTVLSDISGHWGESTIQKSVEAGFVQGYEDGTFKPNNAVKRAEFVSMVNKALKLRDDNTLNLNYSDVKRTDWFYTDLQKASYARYVSGVSEASFMPKKNITRQEAAAMLARILPNSGGENETVLSGYPDVAMISSWARAAMALVVERGYLKGYSNGNLAPSATLTRAEAAKIISLILEKETIVIEDVFLKNANEILQNKIYVGDITIEKSVGEGDATLKNLTALGKVYVLGGGTNTVTVNNSTIIQLIVCKEGTKVRVLSDGDTSIYEAFVFNDNLLVNSQGNNVQTGEGGYSNVIRLTGTVSAETAIAIANEIGKWMDHTGKLTKEQVLAAVGEVAAGSDVAVDSSGNIVVTLSGTNKKRGGGSSSQLIKCSCGLSHRSDVVLTEIVEFNPTSPAGLAVTGYAIYTEAQLQHVAMHLDCNAILMNDLDFSQYATGAGTSTPMGSLKDASTVGLYTSGHGISSFETGKFVPIGNSSVNPYSGMFYGNGKSVTGLVVSGSAVDHVGLFGYTSGAAISDLTLSGAAINGKGNTGSLVGYAKNGTISAISIYGEVFGTNNVGGVVGYNFMGTLTASSNSGGVTGTHSIGGLVGMNKAGGVEDCHNTGQIDSTGDYAGGVVGNNDTGILTNNDNAGEISGYNRAGGVVGLNQSGGTVEDCDNTGPVHSTGNYTGGVVGENNGTITGIHNSGPVHSTGIFTGGVVGYNNLGTLTNSYNMGDISGTADVGGVLGYNITGTLTNSYNTGDISGTGYVGGVVGLSRSGGTVEDCHNTGSVVSTGYATGGVVGYNWANLNNSYNTGTVNSSDLYTGGVVGVNDNGGIVEHSHSTGIVTSTSTYTGGVAGYNNGSGSVQNSYNTGEVIGHGYIGGVVGFNIGTINSSHNTGAVQSTWYSSGGVAGINTSTGVVQNSFNKGTIHSTGERTGGVVGQNNGGTVDRSFNNGSVTSTNKSTGGVAGVNEGVVTKSHNTGAVFAVDWYAGGVAGYNVKDVIASFNTGSVRSTSDYIGGVVGYNYIKVDGCYNAGPVYGNLGVGGIVGAAAPGNSLISNNYNTGAVNSTGNFTGGVVGHNSNNTTVQNGYNTGAVKSTGGYNGSIVGYNHTVVTVMENVYWLGGTHAVGIGDGPGGAVSFEQSDPILLDVYVSMSAITGSAGGTAPGAIDDIIFTGNDATPDPFGPLQGSFITTGSSLTIAIDATEEATITVTTSSSLGTLLLYAGNEVLPTAGTYEISDLANGTWVMIRAIYEDQPEQNRYYTIYKP